MNLHQQNVVVIDTQLSVHAMQLDFLPDPDI